MTAARTIVIAAALTAAGACTVGAIVYQGIARLMGHQ